MFTLHKHGREQDYCCLMLAVQGPECTRNSIHALFQIFGLERAFSFVGVDIYSCG